VLAQGGKGLAAGAELEFGFFVHHRLERGRGWQRVYSSPPSTVYSRRG
jgi:hypothetical protein